MARITVTDIYSDETKEFNGSPEVVKTAILRHYPFLHGKVSQASTLEAVLHQLAGQQAFEVRLENDLQKALGRASTFLNNDANNTGSRLYDHSMLQSMHPDTIQRDVDHFENTINKHPKKIKPIKSMKGSTVPRGKKGVEGKGFYEHEGKRYLVKGGAFKYQGYHIHSGWNELASQNAYHAAGIPELHQKVHASEHWDDKRKQYFPSTVIHMDKGQTLDEIPLDDPEFNRNKRNKHQDAYHKIALMDMALGNKDRHPANILIKPDASPLAIDNGLAFYTKPEHVGMVNHGGDNFTPVSEHVRDWWNENKEKIRNSVHQDSDNLAGKEGARVRRLVDSGIMHVDNLISNHTVKRMKIKQRLEEANRNQISPASSAPANSITNTAPNLKPPSATVNSEAQTIKKPKVA